MVRPGLLAGTKSAGEGRVLILTSSPDGDKHDYERILGANRTARFPLDAEENLVKINKGVH